MIEFVNTPLANDLAVTLFNSLWQAGLLYLLLKLSQLILKKAEPQLHYGLGLVAMIIFFVVNLVTFAYLVDESPMTGTGVIEASSLERMTLLPQQLLPLASENFSPALLVPYGILFWWLGIILFSLRFGFNLYQTRQLVTTGLIKAPAPLEKIFSRLHSQLHIAQKVSLRLSEKVNVPAVIGVVKPIVLLPVGLINGLTTDEVEAILIHELTHIRRHDYLVNIVQSMLEVLYFFNPFVWLLSHELREQRENICDDKALVLGISRKSYAEMLANIYEFAYRKQHMAMSFAGRKNTTLKRIRRIMKRESNNNSLFVSLVLAMVITGAIYFGAEARLTADEIPFYTPESVQLASPVGSFANQDASRLIQSLKNTLESRAQNSPEVFAADTIDEKELEKRIREYQHSMERLQATKEWQEMEAMRKGMVEKQMAIMKELQPQIEEAMKSVDWSIKLDDLAVKELQEKMAQMEIKLGEIEISEEMTGAMEEAAHAMEETMARLEAEMAKVEALELEQMAEEFAAQALASAANAEEVARQAEEIAAEAMQVARKTEAFMAEFKEELVKDGYLKEGEVLKELSFKDDEVLVNGQKVKKKDAEKYNQMREKHLGKDAKFLMNRD